MAILMDVSWGSGRAFRSDNRPSWNTALLPYEKVELKRKAQTEA
jgi:hypothetical protein